MRHQNKETSMTLIKISPFNTVIVGLLPLALSACAGWGKFSNSANDQATATTAALPPARLIFQNGFEGMTRITTKNAQQDILTGADDPMMLSDWQRNLENSTAYFNQALINYEQGNASKRRAEIVPDPALGAPNNKVLRFRIAEPHIAINRGTWTDYKTRIQLDLINKQPAPAGGYLKEYYQKCRVYFPADFKVLEDAPTYMGSFSLQEFANDPPWMTGGKETSLSLQLVKTKNSPGEKLRFNVALRIPAGGNPIAPAKSEVKWEATNESFNLPLGKWMTQEIYVKEGDDKTGRFYMAITVDGVKTVIFDKTALTTHDALFYVPDGQTAWSPLRVTTNDQVVDWFKAQGKSIDVYWDDLEIWLNRRPETFVK
jgi:hypothetical protein